MTVSEYNSCVDQHADSVYRFIAKNLRDNDRAQDIVQEAFARMWEKAADIQAEKSKSYLFTSAYHIMIDSIRKESRMSSVEQISMDIAVSGKEYLGLKKLLDEALQKLPEIQRSVILLRDYEGYSYEEIGQICELTESQVKVYIFRARNTLKKYIVKPENAI
ncbi:MAG: RNA polymerase sigma factor [Sphingobacteriia bacterium]|nr:RNA polymerase sigma factor [Sphingobacteriia bacterium]